MSEWNGMMAIELNQIESNPTLPQFRRPTKQIPHTIENDEIVADTKHARGYLVNVSVLAVLPLLVVVLPFVLFPFGLRRLM